MKKIKKEANNQQKDANGKPYVNELDMLEVESTLVLGDPEKETILEDYDEGALAQAKTYWLFGEWQKLADLDFNLFRSHQHRDRLSLLIASAYQQLGDHLKAREYTRMSLDMGCPSKLVAQILIAGVHNTLGKAAALKNDEERITRHFKESVAAIGTKDSALVTHMRSVREMTKLGLLPQVANLIDSDLQAGICTTQRPRQQQTRMQIIESEINQLKKSTINKETSSQFQNRIVNRTGRSFDVYDESQIIVVAGMRHSGSTALFNIIRLVLTALPVELYSCYSEANDCVIKALDKKGVSLVKTHELRDDLLSAANIVFTSRRDLRDTVASATRRAFPSLNSIGGAGEYAKHNRALHDIWLPYADYEFVYERFMSDPISIVSELLDMLGISYLSSEKILDGLNNLPLDDYNTTLLSTSHITDPDRVLSFSDTLDKSIVESIERQHFSWLERFGYMPTKAGTE